MQSTATQQNDQRNSMILNGSKHQRDLFTGSLGIPDVTTHVGRVVHDFEMMSRSRDASPTGGTIEHPYELHTISNAVDNAASNNDDNGKCNAGVDRRQHAYRKSDSSMHVMAQNPNQQSSMKDRVHRFIDIPTPPPPPVVADNLPLLLPLSSQEIDAELTSNDPTGQIRNMQNKSYFEKTTLRYNKHTLPRTQSMAIENAMDDGNEISEQFIPASQIIRMNETVQKTRPGSSTDGKRNGISRGRTFDDSSSTNATAAATTMQYGNKPKDSISANDYRRKLFGSQPNIIDYKVFNASTAIPANLNSAMFKTNYANIDFRENFDQPARSKRFSQLHTHRRHPKNDTNNNYNAEQIYEPAPSVDIYSVQTDSLGNRFLNRTNQINNKSNNNNANYSRNSNLCEATENFLYQNSATVDDQMLLRGTTVSQSFIKSMKSVERHKALKHFHAHNSGSTSNGFKRVEIPKSTTKRATRSYYRPQKYILHGDDEYDDYVDELRTRYTEYGSSSATLASTKPLSKNFKLSKSGNRFGYHKHAKPV